MMNAHTSASRRLVAASLVAIACLAPASAQGAAPPDPRCAGPGIAGDYADVRGVRFRARRPLALVAIGLGGEHAGVYTFDFELRQSTGFVGPVEAGSAGFGIPLPAVTTPPFPTVLLPLVAFLGPPPEATFTFRFANVTGPGRLYLESHGIGSDDVCADVEETNENDVADPTVRGDPAGFYVLGEPLALCESDGSGHTTAADHGIRFTPLGDRLGTIGVGLRASVPGFYGFAAQIRRSRGFTATPERVVEFATTLGDAVDTHPYPMTFFDFEPIEVLAEDEPFTLRLVALAAPEGGVAHLEQGSSCTSAVTTADATGADPPALAPASNFVAAPEPRADALGFASLAVLALGAAARSRTTRPWRAGSAPGSAAAARRRAPRTSAS